MKMSRLFEIIYLLLNKERLTAKELAERFEVSTRTIYRDIDNISLAGIPVYTEKGKGGGISLLPDFVLNKSVFSEQEQNEILSALQGLTQIQPTDTDNVLGKLSALFNKTAINWLEVDFSAWGDEDSDIWDQLKRSILERNVVTFDYFGSYSEKTHRRVEPLALLFKSRNWYLKAFDLIKQDMRLFKLTRIQDLMVTAESFLERDLSAICQDDPPPEDYSHYPHLKLRIKPEMAHRVLDEFAAFVEEQSADGSYLISLQCPEDDHWIYSTILSLGEYAEVLDPPSMREVIREKAKKIYEHHA
ncbi:MAG: YafY family transcriptional regulator [Oscillospiraceae bacterium]|nr:YafY family transcriptional regulator [Oscillospiraceae bacterium]